MNLKDLAEYFAGIVEEAQKPQIKQIDGHLFTKDGQLMPPRFKTPEPIIFSTLQGIVDFGNRMGEGFYTVTGSGNVQLRGELIKDAGNKRFMYAEARYSDCTNVFGRHFDQEGFILALVSQCVHTDVVRNLCAIASNISLTDKMETDGDGLSVNVVVKKTLTTKAEQKIEIPFPLQPYRTFPEIEQPESDCILRLSQDSEKKPVFILHTSDGGRWETEAVTRIVAWMKKNTELPVMG